MKEKLKYFLIIGIILLCAGCASSKKVQYVPTDAQTIIEYRDTTIHIIDTIKVQIPVEIIKEVTPILDTLRLETSVAKAEAWVDTTNNVLRGKIENKKTYLKAKVDTIVKVEYVDKIVERAVIQEVEVPVKYVPTIYKYSLWFSIAIIAFVLRGIFLKIKGL